MARRGDAAPSGRSPSNRAIDQPRCQRSPVPAGRHRERRPAAPTSAGSRPTPAGSGDGRSARRCRARPDRRRRRQVAAANDAATTRPSARPANPGCRPGPIASGSERAAASATAMRIRRRPKSRAVLAVVDTADRRRAVLRTSPPITLQQPQGPQARHRTGPLAPRRPRAAAAVGAATAALGGRRDAASGAEPVPHRQAGGDPAGAALRPTPDGDQPFASTPRSGARHDAVAGDAAAVDGIAPDAPAARRWASATTARQADGDRARERIPARASCRRPPTPFDADRADAAVGTERTAAGTGVPVAGRPPIVSRVRRAKPRGFKRPPPAGRRSGGRRAPSSAPAIARPRGAGPSRRARADVASAPSRAGHRVGARPSGGPRSNHVRVSRSRRRRGATTPPSRREPAARRPATFDADGHRSDGRRRPAASVARSDQGAAMAVSSAGMRRRHRRSAPPRRRADRRRAAHPPRAFGIAALGVGFARRGPGSEVEHRSRSRPRTRRRARHRRWWTDAWSSSAAAKRSAPRDLGGRDIRRPAPDAALEGRERAARIAAVPSRADGPRPNTALTTGRARPPSAPGAPRRGGSVAAVGREARAQLAVLVESANADRPRTACVPSIGAGRGRPAERPRARPDAAHRPGDPLGHHADGVGGTGSGTVRRCRPPDVPGSPPPPSRGARMDLHRPEQPGRRASGGGDRDGHGKRLPAATRGARLRPRRRTMRDDFGTARPADRRTEPRRRRSGRSRAVHDRRAAPGTTAAAGVVGAGGAQRRRVAGDGADRRPDRGAGGRPDREAASPAARRPVDGRRTDSGRRRAPAASRQRRPATARSARRRRSTRAAAARRRHLRARPAWPGRAVRAGAARRIRRCDGGRARATDGVVAPRRPGVAHGTRRRSARRRPVPARRRRRRRPHRRDAAAAGGARPRDGRSTGARVPGAAGRSPAHRAAQPRARCAIAARSRRRVSAGGRRRTTRGVPRRAAPGRGGDRPAGSAARPASRARRRSGR
ncbi:hypothetical protein ABVK25_012201 [Lepraria finkii]|uniref:Uncharacterized protein n=1 Tax=Lepraria finkii TaxID=1340010 RepID=A0ABR4AH74_9LECA